ncbi:leucine-rich repeat domain-containing protein [Saccharospirillum impatiens]|uniref:leucine-rich repeat domain-containing protein n=1 Tax=Saccharospirillum impatiens TaxID=169438 RepID=UPI0004081B41|nr:leucine-rich repeat domain-containing protein [Saccharospirillum impatiens]
MRHKKRLGLGLLSLALLGNLLSMASADKAVPEFPLTMEALEAFADPDELALVRSYSYYEDSDEHWFLRQHGFVLEEASVNRSDSLVSFSIPGYRIRASYSDNVHTRQDTNQVIWSSEGRLAHLFLGYLSENDLPLVTRSRSLESFSYAAGPEKNTDFDLDILTNLPQLRSLHLGKSQLINFSRVCELEKLEWLTAPVSYPQGQIRFSEDCIAPIRMLGFGAARLDDLEVANLSRLKELYLGNATIHKLAIDGPSLPELEYINLRDTELPDDLSDIDLPEGLVQLNLAEVNSDSVNQLNLPNNLKYLNLDGSQLSDYSFITTAENLESLSLRESAFTQFELLGQLPGLKHLRVSKTAFTQDDLHHLAGLIQLEELDLSATSITDVRPLAEMPNLNVVSLIDTAITDLNRIPAFQQLSYLALPNFDDNYDRPSHLPDHIKAILNKTPDPYDLSKFMGEHCIDSEDCTIAPWLIDDGSP